MDAVTAFVLVTLLVLLNGSVMGFMHKDLPEQLRPSAKTWRIGTLLVAGGSVLLGLQQYGPRALLLPLGNAMLVGGLNAYWFALWQFDDRPLKRVIWVQPMLVAGLMWWFVAMQEAFVTRVVIAAIAWLISCVGMAVTLIRGNAEDRSRSRRVLLGVVTLLGSVMFLRAGYFLFGAVNVTTVVAPNNWVNAVTPMFAATLPVLGTTAFLLMCSDRLRQQWERAALTDHLTGLSNRRTLSDVGAERLAQAKRLKLSLSVALVDIDHFKSVNDRCGHAVGDLALQHVASTLRAVCRREDLVSRQGGEEFVVVFDRLDLEAALLAAERLREAIQTAPLTYPEGTLTLTASFGVAALTANDRHLDELIERADRSLYKAKQAGRNRVEADRP